VSGACCGIGAIGFTGEPAAVGNLDAGQESPELVVVAELVNFVVEFVIVVYM
jgi:hypothetical protein